MRDKRIAAGWLLTAAFILLAAALKPWTADVPLNDDWSYIIPTLRLARENVLKVTGDSPTTHILHVLIGAAWAKIFNTGIGGLKPLIFLWHFAGAFILLRLLREEKVAQDTALLAALVYVFNPLILTLSVSFMTDIPYLTLIIASLYGYLRALRENGLRWIVYGSLAAAGAYLIKQLGLFMPAALTLVLWRTGRWDRRRAAALWLPLACAVLGHQFWYHFIHGPTWAGTADGVYLRALRLLADPSALAVGVAHHTTGMIFHLALFLTPLLAGFAVRIQKPLKFRLGPAQILFAAAGLFLMHRLGKFPYLENYFYHTGIGPPTVFDTVGKAAGVYGWFWFWEAITVLSFGGGLLLLSLLSDALKDARKSPAAALLCCAAFFQLGVSLLTTKYMDRYPLYGLPALIVLLALYAGRRPFSLRAAAGVCALSIAVFLPGAADYVAWNNAKWRLARQALKLGAKPEAVEAGFDWDMYWTYEAKMAELQKIKPLAEIRMWEWRGSLPRESYVSFSPPDKDGAPVPLLEEPYSTPLSLKPAYLYLYAAPRKRPIGPKPNRQ